jgi:hypothetical protein
MVAPKNLGSSQGESAEATRLLRMIEDYLPKDDDTLVRNSVIRMTELALKEIEKNGGKVSASLIGMLSHSEDLADILLDLNEKKNPEFEEAVEKRSDFAGALAHEILQSGLVELPVFSRGRSLGR